MSKLNLIHTTGPKSTNKSMREVRTYKMNGKLYRIVYNNINGGPEFDAYVFSDRDDEWNQIDHIGNLDMSEETPCYVLGARLLPHLTEFFDKMEKHIEKIYG
jgi:hypothetical protein